LCLLVGSALLGGSVVVSAGPAGAAPARPGAAVEIALTGEPLVRVDRDPTYAVTVTGLDSRTRARVSFGDGTAVVRQAGSCSVARAARTPASCSRTFTHTYRSPGTYTITAIAGRDRVVQQVTIAPKPEPWRPAAGQQFTSWRPLGRQATYTPCQTVEWHLDSTGQPADRSTIRTDIIASLAELSALTNLRFVETDNPATADLKYSWRDLSTLGYADEAAAVGGFTGPSQGWVAFSPTNEWTNDYWAGDQPKTKRWQDDQYVYTLTINGRQTLVTHETMHALGFGHVEDFTSIMYPQSIGNGAGQLSAGDLEGLAAMYGSLPCPLIPD